MKVRFEDVSKNEILKYLSYRGNEIPVEIDEQIDECIVDIIEKSSFLYTFREFDIYREKLENYVAGRKNKLTYIVN